MRKFDSYIRGLLTSVLAVIAGGALADIPVQYHASVTAQASSKSLAPYMLGSWNYGRYVQGSGIWQEAGILKPLNLSHRFNWSAGFDYIAGYGVKSDYRRWNDDDLSWSQHKVGLPNVRITQFFGQLKYRAGFLTVGMKNNHSGIVDDYLSSGDLTRSNNAMAIPGVAIGFLDFQNIPFTKGWVQIGGEIMYGKMLDSNFKKDEFNYYSGVEAINLYYNYKRCYFRTNPEKRFHVIVGMQAAGIFGGSSYSYQRGSLRETTHRKLSLRRIWQMFFPMEGEEDFYEGNHVGSWDLKAVYRMRDGAELNAYFEWPWEDGTGIGKQNGWDGLWGLQYNFAKKGIVSKAVVEYLDFTNQAGPMHFHPGDNPNTPITGRAQGADNYYNNDYYGSYSNYGMSIGTPFLVSPIYNHNGALEYLHNRARGFHVGIEGNPSDRISYRLLAGYEKAGGYGRVAALEKTHSTSAMAEANVIPVDKIPELEMGVRLAFDKGDLRGDNFGVQLKVEYKGSFNIKKKAK